METEGWHWKDTGETLAFRGLAPRATSSSTHPHRYAKSDITGAGRKVNDFSWPIGSPASAWTALTVIIHLFDYINLILLYKAPNCSRPGSHRGNMSKLRCGGSPLLPRSRTAYAAGKRRDSCVDTSVRCGEPWPDGEDRSCDFASRPADGFPRFWPRRPSPRNGRRRGRAMVEAGAGKRAVGIGRALHSFLISASHAFRRTLRSQPDASQDPIRDADGKRLTCSCPRRR